MIVFISPAATAFSIDYSIGAYFWYTWWHPSSVGTMRGKRDSMKDNIPENDITESYEDHFKSSPTLMMGPYVNARLSERWSSSLVLLYGSNFYLQSGFKQYDNTASCEYDVDISFKFQRFDGDFSTTYRINNYFTGIIGFKYLFYKAEGTRSMMVNSMLFLNELNYFGHFYGPSVGISGNVFLIEGLYLNVSFSGIYLKTSREHKNYYVNDGTTGVKNLNEDYYGINSVVSVGYYFHKYNSNIATGFRYQKIVNENDLEESFFGIILYFIYYF